MFKFFKTKMHLKVKSLFIQIKFFIFDTMTSAVTSQTASTFQIKTEEAIEVEAVPPPQYNTIITDVPASGIGNGLENQILIMFENKFCSNEIKRCRFAARI